MRICIVSQFFYPLLNGVSVRVLKDAQALQEAGHEVFVLCPGTGTPDVPSVPAGKPPARLGFGVWRALLRLNREKKIDVVIGHNALADVLSFPVARILGARFIAQVHGPEREEFKNAPLSSFRKTVALFLCRLDGLILRRAERIIVVEKEIAPWLVEAHRVNEDAILHIANYPDLSRFTPQETTNHPFTVGYLGTLQKGRVEPLLDAARSLPELRFLVVGDGDARDDVDTQKNVERTVETDQRAIPALLAQMDVGIILPLVSGSRVLHKGPPMKLYEYLACGLPVIGINLPELADPVTKYDLGLLIRSDELPQAVRQVQKNLAAFRDNVRRFRSTMERSADWRQEKLKLVAAVARGG